MLKKDMDKLTTALESAGFEVVQFEEEQWHKSPSEQREQGGIYKRTGLIKLSVIQVCGDRQ